MAFSCLVANTSCLVPRCVNLLVGFFEKMVHAFDLPLSPWMFGPGAAVFGRVLLEGISERHELKGAGCYCCGLFLNPCRVWRVVTNVRAVIGEHGMNGYRGRQPVEPSGSSTARRKDGVTLNEKEVARMSHFEIHFFEVRWAS